MRRLTISAVLSLCLACVACSGIETKAEYPAQRLPGDKDITYGKREGIFGKGGISLLGGSKKKDTMAGSITVNAYLWRASLDTLSFMPIDSADPFGGTIITDWYQAPDVMDERVKANVFIMGRELRTDLLKVTLFRQVKTADGWQNAKVDPATITELENAILTRARQLKVAAASE